MAFRIPPPRVRTMQPSQTLAEEREAAYTALAADATYCTSILSPEVPTELHLASASKAYAQLA